MIGNRSMHVQTKAATLILPDSGSPIHERSMLLTNEKGGAGPTVLLLILALPFIGVGVFTSFQAYHAFQKEPLDLGEIAFSYPFAVVFGGVGLLLAFVALFGKEVPVSPDGPAPKKFKAMTIRGKTFKSVAQEWEERCVTCSNMGRVFGTGFVLVLSVVLLAPVLLLVPWELFVRNERAHMIWLLAYLIPLAALFSFFRSWTRWKKYGESKLSFPRGAAVPGGEFSGTITCSSPIQPTGAYTLTLACTETIVHGSGKNRTVSKKILWSEEQTMPASANARAGIAFRFALPPDARPTWEAKTNSIAWKVSITAPTPGVNYDADFPIPVHAPDKPDAVDSNEDVR